MKKFFTLIAASILCVGGVNATEVDLSLTASYWTWGWNCDSSNDDGGNLVGTLNDDYGAISCGWNDGTDFTAYTTINVVIESYNNDWGKVYFSYGKDGSVTAEVSFSTITSSTTVTLEIPEDATDVMQFAIQGKAAGDEIVVSRVYLSDGADDPVYEEEGKTLNIDEWGNILAAEFDGFSDDAKVVFTYNIKDFSDVYSGWGMGSIKSLGGNVTVTDNLPATAEGEHTYTTTVGALADALADGPDDYERYGLYWNMWSQNDDKYKDTYPECVATRVSCIVYELADDTPTDGIVVGATDYSSVWWTAFSDLWTLEDGYTFHTKFTNYNGYSYIGTDADGNTINCRADGSVVYNWNNWVLVCTDDASYSASCPEPYTGTAGEHFVLRADNYGWGDTNYDESTLSNTYDWTNFVDLMNGAEVEMTVSKADGVISVTVVTTKGDNTYDYSFSYSGATEEQTGLFFTVEAAYIVIDTEETYVCETGIGAVTVEDAAASTAVYNLAGQQVGESYKGVVVKNGKKVLQK